MARVDSFGSAWGLGCRGRNCSRVDRSGGPEWHFDTARGRRGNIRDGHADSRRRDPGTVALETHVKCNPATGASEPTCECRNIFHALLGGDISREERKKINLKYLTYSTTRRLPRLSIDFNAPGWLKGSSQIVWSAAKIQNFRNSDFSKADTQKLSTRGK